jgi:hypothetical protein
VEMIVDYFEAWSQCRSGATEERHKVCIWIGCALKNVRLPIRLIQSWSFESRGMLLIRCLIPRKRKSQIQFLNFSLRNPIGKLIFNEKRLQELRILSIIQNSKQLENTTFRKLDLFPSSGDRKETPTLLGPLERANLNHWFSHNN